MCGMSDVCWSLGGERVRHWASPLKEAARKTKVLSWICHFRMGVDDGYSNRVYAWGNDLQSFLEGLREELEEEKVSATGEKDGRKRRRRRRSSASIVRRLMWVVRRN